MYFVCAERSFYWIFWIFATVYALYQYANLCQSANHLYRLNAQDFRDGTLSENLYDASDFEWQSFKKLYTDYWYIVLIHFTLSNIFTVFNQPVVSIFSIIVVVVVVVLYVIIVAHS